MARRSTGWARSKSVSTRARSGARRSSTTHCRWCRPGSSTASTTSNEGDLPYGFEPDDIVPLVVTALNLYWTFDAGGAGIEFPELTLVPVSSSDEISCDDISGPVEQTAVVCPSTNEVYIDEPFAEQLYNDPIEGRADFAVGYLIATGWAEEAQIQLGSPLTGEPRALANDCLVGAWTADMLPGRELRPEEGDSRGQVSPGDLDEAVLAAITVGDPGLRRRPHRQRLREDR